MKGPEAKFETQPEDAGRMDLESAQTEANMVRAIMDLNPTTGKRNQPYSNFRTETPTVEDYGRAEAKIEELLDQVHKEPMSEKLISAGYRLLENIGYSIGQIAMPRRDLFKLQDEQDRHKTLIYQLTDAAHELRKLQKAASKFQKMTKE